MHNAMLARDYEVPKKSLFLLEGDDLVQNRDVAAYISNSVCDSVMYGTNGNLGIRHRSEMETVGFKTGVMLNGVYHVQPRESVIRCTALPTEYHTGAAVCTVDMDCRIDGVSGTLSTIPTRRLSLADGAYRSSCESVISSDGQVVFDCSYTRAVATSDLSAWAAEVCYNNFRLDVEPTSGSDRGGGGGSGAGAGVTGMGSGIGGSYSDDTGGMWANYGHHLTPSLDSNELRAGSRSSPRPVSNGLCRMEFVVTFMVELEDWEVIKATQMDDVWQRSLTSNILVNTTTNVTCTAQFPAGVDPQTDGYGSSSYPGNAEVSRGLGSCYAPAAAGPFGDRSGTASAPPTTATSVELTPEVEIIACTDDLDTGGQPRELNRYTTSAFVTEEDDQQPGSDGEEAGSGMCAAGMSGNANGAGAACANRRSGGPIYGSEGPNFSNRSCCANGANCSACRPAGHTGGRGFGDRYSPFMSAAGSPTFSGAAGASTNGKPQYFLIRKRFVCNLTHDSIPERVVLSFHGRHVASNNNRGGIMPTRPVFPSLKALIRERKESLDEFWRTHEVDLQLQEELIPDRTKLALRYNAFRLFGVSYDLENGLTRSGCSCSGDALQYDLRQYLYHGLYYLFSDPPSCLAILRFLHKLLPQARVNAQKLAVPCGALFPECTITGVNTKFYTSIVDVRFHVNAIVGKLIQVYHIAIETICEQDRLDMLEMMLETARVWLALGEWREDGTTFHLENLSGADEYSGKGNGNFYIHLSAKNHMATAAKMLETQDAILGVDKVNRLLESMRMTREEVVEMEEASVAIVVPRKEHANAFMVHENFDSLTPWDTTERAKHPLSLNYHPLAIFRKKVIDVPEVLLGMLTHDWLFDRNDFERNLSYYAPLCALDTPESMALFAISLCRARENFAQPIPLLRSLLHLDLDNLTYQAEEGLNFGSMSAAMLTFIFGVGGTSIRARSLHLNPVLPAGVNRYSFTVCWRGSVVKTTLDRDTLVYELVSGDSVRFIHGNGMNRIHLHTGFRRCEATQRISIPRRHFSQVGQFDGAIFLSDCIFSNLLEYSYVSWYRTLESLFENYRALHQRAIPPLTPEEFIAKVVYQTEEREISFSGIHSVLLHRGINLDVGTPDDAEIVETRYGLANAKVAEMAELLAQQPPKVNPAIFNLVRGLAHNGVACAIVTYSRSLKQLMWHSTELANFFVARIDGEEAHDRGIRGRPHLDLFLKAAEKIHVDPRRCLVVSHHLDKDYVAEDFAQFRMFLDVDDPFVSSRTPPNPYPCLDDDGVAKFRRDNPVVCRLPLDQMPSTIDELEDIIEGRPRKQRF